MCASFWLVLLKWEASKEYQKKKKLAKLDVTKRNVEKPISTLFITNKAKDIILSLRQI